VTEPQDSKVTLDVSTQEPLAVGQRQTLGLKVTSKGYDSITFVVPLGNDAASLMTADEFNKTKGKIKITQPSAAVSLGTPAAAGNEATVRVIIKEANKPAEFLIAFQNFMVNSSGTVKIRAIDAKKNLLADRDVSKSSKPPRITSFTAKPYNLIQGGSVALTWSVEPPPSDGIELRINGQALAVDKSATTASVQVKGLTECTLEARAGGKSVDQRQLRIHAFDETRFSSYALGFDTTDPPGQAKGVLGLHAHAERGRLYALLREDDAWASLWGTAHGFDCDRAQWRVEVDKRNRRIRIPLQAARRPGIIFMDKLWLIGGDCCDPDRPGSDVGYYDFQAQAWFDDDPAPWPARMGHALVAAEDGWIWVIGGWTQDGGSRYDIQRFDGTDWKLLWPLPPWGRGRCLFGATATTSSVWIAGGFATPGGAPTFDDILRYDKAAKTWEVLQTSISPDKSKPQKYQYCASMLFTMDDRPYAITTYFDTDRKYLHNVYVIGRVGNWAATPYEIKKTSTIGVMRDLDYYRLDATVFNGSAFLRVLQPGPRWVDSNIHYFTRVRET